MVSKLSILLKVDEQISHLYDGRDEYDPSPLAEALKQLSAEERKQWYVEAEYLDKITPTLGDVSDNLEAARPLLIKKFG